MTDRETSTPEPPFAEFCAAVRGLLDQQAADKALANLERKVETFGGERLNAIDSLRAELLVDDGREERDQTGTEGNGLKSTTPTTVPSGRLCRGSGVPRGAYSMGTI